MAALQVEVEVAEARVLRVVARGGAGVLAVECGVHVGHAVVAHRVAAAHRHRLDGATLERDRQPAVYAVREAVGAGGASDGEEDECGGKGEAEGAIRAPVRACGILLFPGATERRLRVLGGLLRRSLAPLLHGRLATLRFLQR